MISIKHISLKSPEAGLNHRPFAYKANALPLSYGGDRIIYILFIKNYITDEKNIYLVKILVSKSSLPNVINAFFLELFSCSSKLSNLISFSSSYLSPL